MNLSPHFSLAELVSSQVATRKGIDNAPSPSIVVNLTRLAALLEQVRALVGTPIAISSGYRSPALNRAVGGAANSAHVLGLAADISTAKLAPKALAMLIRQSDIAFDQLIYEGTWVHIGLSTGAPRRQVLTAKFAGGGVSYVAGIV
ncbi:peptidase M15 [Janthinobacterium sp. FT14W]|uniref:D-Ala-D-Ala carboxypeptidase family metallohydrolase n=1 Tax=Janthinobacterium sp. FT14W TaxID=2654253 RepID=UPI001265379E|nr:D-Ala-D-Ala carboxypeptidase family metallohydrolase [Janthinobacterium sp. FT14W]KAB8052275.1 peptidase M15 [Janthinobacterium sp. FT14W]